MNRRTATMLFINASGIPIEVLSATADVFYFANDGTRIWILPKGTPMFKVVGEVGRYTLTFDVPKGVSTVYASMFGIDPETNARLANEQQIVR